MKTLASAVALLSLLAPSLRAQTFAQTFIAKSAKLQKAITSSSLNSALKSGFVLKFNKILTDAKCASTGEKITCEHATPSTIETAQDAADSLSDDLAAAIKADSGKSLADLYKPKTDALFAALKALTPDNKDRMALEHRITAFQNGFASKDRPLSSGDPAATAQDKFQALKDDVDAAVQLSAVAGEAGGFVQAFADKAAKVRANINFSKLAATFQSDFNLRLGKIISTAKCDEAALKSKSPAPCPKATPATIESAQEALDTLSDDLSAAIASDGSKSLADVYKPKTDALLKSLARAALTPKDSQALQGRVEKFQTGLGTGSSFKGGILLKPGAPGAADQVAAAQTKYQELADDVAAAIQLAATGGEAGGGFATTFLNNALKVHASIAASPLVSAFKRDFDLRLDKILTDAKCTVQSDALSAATLGKRTSSCAKATPLTIAPAQEALDVLSIDLAGAIKADGGKSLADVYKTKTDALATTLKNSRVEGVNRQALLNSIDAFLKSLAPNPGARGAGADLAAAAQDKFDALTKNVNAAIELSPITAADAAPYTKKIVALQMKLIDSRVSDADKKPIADAIGSFKNGLTSLQLTFADARDQFAGLTSQVDAAIQAAPAPSDAYTTKTNVLMAELRVSSVALKDALVGRINAFSQGLRKLSAADAEAQFQTLKSDVEGAIALAPLGGGQALQLDAQAQALSQKLSASNLSVNDAKPFAARISDFSIEISPVKTAKSGLTVEAARHEFDALSADVDAAIALAPASTSRYESKLENLGRKLDAAKVAAADQKPMLDRIVAFKGELFRNALSVGDAEKEFAAISSDVDLTIQQLGTPPQAAQDLIAPGSAN